MNRAGHHNYYILGAVVLLALVLLAPYFGIHIFGTQPQTPAASTKPTPIARTRPPQQRRKLSRPPTLQTPRPRKKNRKLEREQRDSESLSDIENLLK